MPRGIYGLRDIQMIISIVCTNGELDRDKDVQQLIGLKINKDVHEFMIGFADLALNTKFLDECTKIYMTNPGMPIRAIREILSKKTNGVMNYDTKKVNNILHRDLGRIRKAFGPMLIDDILYSARPNVKPYMVLLHTAKSRIMNNGDIRNNLVTNVRKCVCDEGDLSISADDFEQLLIAISPYVKRNMDMSMDAIPQRVCWYFHYLIDNQELLDGEDLDRFKTLRTLLTGEV